MSQSPQNHAAPREDAFDPALGFKIVTWIGIIEQLARTKANRELTETGLPWNQFVLLNHFSHRPAEGKTVTGVARAMQQQQPGVTKTMKSMVDAGLLRIEPDAKDGRIKRHFITDIGQKSHAEAVQRLLPEISQMFQNWTGDEMADLFGLLDRLKIWLDDNR
ncbi:MarR family winged helix-turn-helix transcriptional regulator [Hwanghaeella grinnelliae]|nr:MarR family winged helix-turn-helix transcriptional regulator [Hwanghaeella grinnelliae]